MRDAFRRGRMQSQHLAGRLRLRGLAWLHPGLRVAADASAAFGFARFNLAPGARLEIGPGAATEHRPGALNFVVHPGGRIVLDEGAWLRTEVGPVTLVAYPGAEIVIGPGALLNACSVSAKHRVEFAQRAMLGPGSRVYDSDQHDFDDQRPEAGAPVFIGAHAWVSSDVTVLKGVRIGEHCVVGTRALVTSDLPPHTLATGIPARPRGKVGDRSRAS